MNDNTDRLARVDRILTAARTALGMDLAFITELGSAQRFVRFSGEQQAASFGWFPGLQIPAEAGYCHHVITGQIPGLLPDTAADPVAAGLAVTAEAGIGSYAAVPLRLPDGRLYGALCAVAHQPRPLRPGDEQILTVLAALLADELSALDERDTAHRRQTADFQSLLAPGAITVHTQPIVDLRDGTITGLEALARFPAHPGGPAAVFASADALGLGVDLELAAADTALRELPQIPAPLSLSVNVSPTAILDPRLDDLLAAADTARLVLELTEHIAVADYPRLLTRLQQLTGTGLRIAVDDAGSGFASLRHIIDLRPHIIKLDISLVQGVDSDPARRALARAVAHFAQELGALLIAEGIETHAELTTLRDLGITHGQGFHLGRPAPLHTHDLPRPRYTGPERRNPAARPWTTPKAAASTAGTQPTRRSATG